MASKKKWNLRREIATNLGAGTSPILKQGNPVIYSKEGGEKGLR